VPEVSFQEAPFDQVIEWLQDYTKLNISVRWTVLETLGLERDKPISINARNLRVSQVLWMVMNEAAGAEVVLAYRASGNLLILSSAEDLGQEMITRVYDFTDLLFRVKRFTNSPRIDLTQQSSGGGGGGGQSVFGGEGGGEDDEEEDEDGEGEDPQMTELVELITSTIEPDSWQVNGGRGTIVSFRRQIVVRNNLLVHQAIGGPISE
jgi:hypothetical protein